jgi:ABC-type Na+ transport system ATPase subunit NatA
MPEEIREHMMGHKIKDRVREAYFLADPDELRKIYLRYIEHLSMKNSGVIYSSDEIRELQRQNNRLCDTVTEMKKGAVGMELTKLLLIAKDCLEKQNHE